MTRWIGKLRGAVPGSVTTRGLLLVLLVILSVAVPGAVAHWLLTRHEEQRHDGEVEAFLGLALAAHLKGGADAAAGSDEWLHRVQQQGGHVCWAAVLRRDGGGLEFRQRANLTWEQVSTQVDLDTRMPTSKPLLLGNVVSRRFELLTIPTSDDDVTLAAVLDRGEHPHEPPSLALLVLLGVSLVGLVIAWVWFEYGIQRPILRLGRTVASVREGLTEVALGDMPPAELAPLVAAVEQTQEEMKRWRLEATQLRHSVEAEVDARTRRAARAQRRAEREAETDPLTRLGNRRVFERDMPALFRRQCLGGGELSLIMLDVDRFKAFNDSLGHQAGDDLLAFVGELICAMVRKGTDLAVRYGGDEFVIALPDTNTDDACGVARRLILLFGQRVRVHADDVVPGLSAGVASLRLHAADTWEDLLRMADEAMYWAKRQHSRVATIQDVPTSTS